MRVKSLQITGFKSFVDKTVFQFGSGITGIVGPNGCGKSNVVDAIRWAMGEQSPRHLRGKGMQDVIFGGSQDRAPVGMAEVVLSFDNSDGQAPPAFAGFSEIQVSRRLYRSGESEYAINKVACRLRDVLDFFRDTGIGTKGYTIVEQGRIAEIVSAKPEERRALIEEAAGISKYKARRREAERKLEATDQNLVRVSDVLGEIKRQISSIERQARKAARYKRLRETQRLLELSIAADEREELAGQIEAGRRRAVELGDAATESEARLAEIEAQAEVQRVELADSERVLTQGSEDLFQLRASIKELESQIGYERRERASLAESNVARERERERLTEQHAGAQEEAARHRDELAAVEAALAADAEAMAEAEREVAAAGGALRAVEAERETCNGALVDVLTRIARAEDRRAVCDDRRALIDRRQRSTDEQLEVQQSEAAQVDREQEALEQGLRNLLAERDRLMGALRETLERNTTCGEEARAGAEALQRAREQRETRRARLESLRELLERGEDVGEGARHLLGQGELAAREHGIRGLVRDVLEAPAAVERAVEAVLAERAEGLVVDRLEGALSALESLRAEGRGRSVFVALPSAAPEPQGFVPLGEPLRDRVRVRPGFEAIGQRLLAGVNLVEDLEEAVRVYGAARIPATFVTPQGDLLTPDGVIRGGATAERGALARVREVRELEDQVSVLDAEVARQQGHSQAAEAGLRTSSDELDNLRNRHHTAALAVANHEKDLERTRERVKAIGEAQEGRVVERSELLAESEALAEEVVRLDQLLRDSTEERSRRQRELDGLGLQVGSAARELSRVEAVGTERRVQQRGRSETRDRLGETLARSEAAVAEAAEWIGRREEEIRSADTRREELAGSIHQAELSLAGRLREEEASRRTNEEKRDTYERVAAVVRGVDQEARGLRGELDTQRADAQQAELGLREMELRLDHLATQIRDKWSVDIVSWKAPVPAADAEPEIAPTAAGVEAVTEGAQPSEGLGAVPSVSADEGEADDGRDAQREARKNAELLTLPAAERRTHLADLRKKVEAIGEVNLGAIEEHEELRERFRFLTEQKTDLEGSIAQLRDAIGRINRTSRKRFRETFDAVNERFELNFPRLFRGGKASLSLTESEDVLEAGIEIMAQPPGKRLQSVNLLSGGEKTMTAIALLVSVFQVRPSPFFLLDEVDAALDDANVGRFNEIVVELAESSQFLLITHNKRTIEVADMLYGVTMEERGASKLVGVELH